MTNPRGRQPIGLNQPPNSGNLYPFVSPSADIKQLFTDFFVSFENSNDQVVYPLHVAWLYGFGTNVVTPFPGRPTPTHDYDLIVEDNDGNIVFDSTTAVNYLETLWDNRLRIIEWTNLDSVCRCVIHTEWTAEDIVDGLDITYDDNIEPANGELYAECYYELPKRVRSITVGAETITAKSLVIQNGYNFDLQLTEPIELQSPALDLFGTVGLIEGTRNANRIQLIAEPGAGLGVFPGCGDAATVLRTINKVKGNAHNNFTLDSEGCIRQHRSVVLASSNPRTFNYSSGILSPNQSKAALRLSNDCKNCCDCEYYARTYQGLKRQWFLYRDIAQTAEQARDFFKENKERWLAEKEIREKEFIRVTAITDTDCKVRWGVALCNPTNCCLLNIKIQIFFMPYIGSTLTYGVNSFSCPDTYVEASSTCNQPVAIVPEALDAENHIQRYTVDYADPQTLTLLYGKQCLPSCFSFNNYSISVGVVAYWENQAPVNGTCKPATDVAFDMPDDIVSFCGLAGVAVPSPVYGSAMSVKRLMINGTNGCASCNCEPEE